MTVTREQIGAYLSLVRAVADSIKEAGSIPAGTVYAACMTTGMSLEHFEKILGMLTDGGLVKRDQSGMLHWVG